MYGIGICLQGKTNYEDILDIIQWGFLGVSELS
jgi:hypothetical protein